MRARPLIHAAVASSQKEVVEFAVNELHLDLDVRNAHDANRHTLHVASQSAPEIFEYVLTLLARRWELAVQVARDRGTPGHPAKGPGSSTDPAAGAATEPAAAGTGAMGASDPMSRPSEQTPSTRPVGDSGSNPSRDFLGTLPHVGQGLVVGDWGRSATHRWTSGSGPPGSGHDGSGSGNAENGSGNGVNGSGNGVNGSGNAENGSGNVDLMGGGSGSDNDAGAQVKGSDGSGVGRGKGGASWAGIPGEGRGMGRVLDIRRSAIASAIGELADGSLLVMLGWGRPGEGLIFSGPHPICYPALLCLLPALPCPSVS